MALTAVKKYNQVVPPGYTSIVLEENYNEFLDELRVKQIVRDNQSLYGSLSSTKKKETKRKVGTKPLIESSAPSSYCPSTELLNL